jgi:phosphoglycolate phosphatase
MKKSSKKKLALFDIDGTLVSTTRESIEQWRIRVVEVFKYVYGKDLDPDFDLSRVNGKVERRYFREIAEMLGVSKETFEEKFPQAAEYFHQLLTLHVQNKNITFTRITEAWELVGRLRERSDVDLGLVTGNIEKNAWLKLKSADFHTPFAVGGFGDHVEDRGDLVLEAIQKAERHFGSTYDKADIVVIGDTIHDIASAKKAGVVSVGVATGVTESFDALVAAGGDIVVNTLIDEAVLTVFGLDGKPNTKKRRTA